MSSKNFYNVVVSPPKLTSPVVESDDVEEDLMFAKRSKRCCFCIPCFGSQPSSSTEAAWERIPYGAGYKDPWLNRGWKKIREWSELIAGPKWKTFIRRFNKNNGHGKRSMKFQYDPMGYSLNFDEGPGQSGNLDDDYVYRDFSCRYASIPVSAKSSMDFGKDGPSFT